MDLRRTNDALISFALSAMFTSALLTTAPGPIISAATGPFSELANQAGVQAPPQIHEPLSIPSKLAPSISPISDEQFQKIIALINGIHANVIDIRPEVSAAFGLDKDNSTISVRNISLKYPQIKYEISHLNKDKGYLLACKNGSVMRFFLMDENRSLLSGLLIENDLAPVIMPTKDAETLFPQVLAFWAKIANKLPPVSTPPSA